jgi:hypothetical protein
MFSQYLARFLTNLLQQASLDAPVGEPPAPGGSHLDNRRPPPVARGETRCASTTTA